MKFYSEKLDTLFDTEEELVAAENNKSEKEKQLVCIKEKVNACMDKIFKNLGKISDYIGEAVEIDEDFAIDLGLELIHKMGSFTRKTLLG